MSTHEIVFAGFGGQGILFSGKILVYAGLIAGLEVSWLPSYGPEMRGGTANCNVIISDLPIGSPIITTPGILVAMNQPSLAAFENVVLPGGMIFVNSAIIASKVSREDVKVVYIPVTRLADENRLTGLANMIMVGKLIKETGVCSVENIKEAVEKSVSDRKKDLLDANIRAIEIGYYYE